MQTYCMNPALLERLREWFEIVEPAAVGKDGSLVLNVILQPADRFEQDRADLGRLAASMRRSR